MTQGSALMSDEKINQDKGILLHPGFGTSCFRRIRAESEMGVLGSSEALAPDFDGGASSSGFLRGVF
jgi:hypothetical protein